ncbi:serine hydrolase [Amycolatopsis sp. BJA-103]|uniref:serine hydrolase domain-containing protein n=1 Tax=Amycolatopsis sp. BJA-103 TaxID=1911175 RepID=UPI000C769C35|nr:serine hydrolase domain-containing protein [Amycolatopsis sp. BJA-103]AUI63578.1 penicillin-binding protein [Amycolatopsis sp. BJA-103]PNE19422.1 penicillin-binding protein [Amycolatopsis sp. BJA-103]
MDFAELDAWLTERAGEDRFSGVVLIRRGDETLFERGYGLASRRWSVPNAPDIRYDTASITKVITAIAALQLVEQGRLDLDRPIGEIIDLTGTAIATGATTRQLLTHTSGIADDADEEAGESYEALWVDKPVYSVVNTRDHLPNFAYRAANFAPGEGCRYCNSGYVLAGLVIEAIVGGPYREYVQETVLDRAGMAESGFFDRRDPQPRVAEGWDEIFDGDVVTGWKQNIFSYPPIGSPDGGAYCTVGDLVLFLRAIREERLLSPERTKEFLTPQVLHSKGVWYGFGLEFVLEQDGSVWNCYKDGGNAGVCSLARHYPGEGLDVAMLSNATYGGGAAIQEIDRVIRAG